jgi:hypothetical protein
MVSASFRDLPHVTPDPQKAFLPPGPIRSRSIRQREQRNDRMAAEGVEETGAFSVRWRGTHPLPLGGGECEFQQLSNS